MIKESLSAVSDSDGMEDHKYGFISDPIVVIQEVLDGGDPFILSPRLFGL